MVATRSSRSCEHTTALGAPVVPDVNSRKIWSDGFTFVVGRGASANGASVSAYAASSMTRTRPSAAPSSSPSSSSRWRRSVTMSWHSVWLMSRSRPSPRRVGLMPTIVAAHSRRGTRPHREVGNVVEQQADVWRTVDAHRLEQRRPRRARLHPLVVGPRLVFEAQCDVGSPALALTRSAKIGHLPRGDGLGVAARAQHRSRRGAGGLPVFDDRRAVHEHPHDADGARR